jgi:hypothetical protein
MNIEIEHLGTLSGIPLHLDGSDGSMWPTRDNESDWMNILGHDEGGISARRFIRVSDLIAWFRSLPLDPPTKMV